MTKTTLPLDRAKWSFTARRVPRSAAHRLGTAFACAVPGDLVLAEVLEVGQHRNVQLAEGRLSELYVGDLVVLACGDRYAPDQFEAVAEIDPDGADMVAGGGLIGRMTRRHEQMKPPTRVRPLGLLEDRAGRTLNVGDWALPTRRRPGRLTVVGITGASMNSGKTTAAAALAHGLTRAGLRVAALKATGTGAFADFNAFRDAGAAYVADFTDAGMASTFRQPLERITRGLDTLLGHAAETHSEVAVVELADGVFQKETAEILASPALRGAFHGFLLAAPDALAAVGGVHVLGRLGIRPLAIAGLLTRSPLATAEAAAETGVVVLSRHELCRPDIATGLLAALSPPAIQRAA